MTLARYWVTRKDCIHSMVTTDARTMWQRTSSNRIQEETLRAPKLAHCPILPKTQPEICQPIIVRGFENTPSYYWSNSWGSLDTKTVWQMSPSAQCDYRSDNLALDEILESRCTKPAGLQEIAAQQSTNVKSGHQGPCFSLWYSLLGIGHCLPKA